MAAYACLFLAVAGAAVPMFLIVDSSRAAAERIEMRSRPSPPASPPLPPLSPSLSSPVFPPSPYAPPPDAPARRLSLLLQSVGDSGAVHSETVE